VAVGLWLALLFLGERALPAAAPPQGNHAFGWRRVARNAGLWLINTGLSPLVVVPLSAWAATHALDWRPDWWSGWPGLVIDVVLLDMLIYWWHRANHESRFLWRFHEMHHRDEFLDSTSAIRFHFGEVLLSALARAVVIVLLGIPLTSVLVFEAIVLMASIFHHSNLRLPPRLEQAISRLIVTPSIHWVHHHALRTDTDSNYGTVFSFWDPLFRSRSLTSRTPDMKIGVAGRPELPLKRLLLQPFLGEN
jgi:sterol desaturase/sphingolipid hydroxylase (fatty acid hydroxylase superfamily)